MYAIRSYYVVIPIKDERDNLTPLTDQLLKVLEAQEESKIAPFEIIYVDDGSTDGSSEIMDRLAAEHGSVTVLHFDRNYGQSAGFDAGFKHATGALVATLDGDLQNDPADIRITSYNVCYTKLLRLGPPYTSNRYCWPSGTSST